MKHPSTTLLGLLACMLATAVVSLTPARAEAKDTYWTSVEGVTIWARLTGLEGSNLMLIKGGHEYRVPLSRLTPESAAKARRLLAVPADTDLAARPEHRSDYSKSEELPVDAADAEELDGLGGLLPPPLRFEREEESSSSIRLENRRAIAPSGIPSIIQTAIDAGNRLQDKIYKWGGGRARLEDNGYDCSGSVSYVLIHAGLLRSPLTSGSFTRYGVPGPGRWITLYARNGHVFMTVCGLRLDTGGHGGRGESGPRWCRNFRSTGGFVMRHPPGL